MDKQQPIEAQAGPQPQIVTDPSAAESERQQLNGRLEHPDILHEGTDISFRGIGVAVVVIGAALAAVVGAVRLFVDERKASDPDQAQRSPALPVEIPLPRTPRLEAIESPTPANSSFAAAQQKREDRLRSSGPTEEPGFVHIPINKAMEKAANDLQSQAQPAQRDAKSLGLISGGEANSGRVFREGSR
jgi:hypothetical protein